MTSAWIDVSVTLKTGMVNWPGDPPARISHALDMQRGDPCTASLLEMGAHTGTHMDGPRYFLADGAGLDELLLDSTIGPARVIRIAHPQAILPAEQPRRISYSA